MIKRSEKLRKKHELAALKHKLQRLQTNKLAANTPLNNDQ